MTMILARIRYFFFAFAAVMVSTGFMVAVVNTAQTNTRLVAQAQAYSTERQTLLSGQRDLQAKYSALIAWLRTQPNVPEIPASVLNGTYVARRATDSSDGGSSDSSKGSGRQSAPKSGGTSAPAAVAPAQSASKPKSDKPKSGGGDNGNGKGSGGGGSSGGSDGGSRGKSAEHAEPAGNPKHDK